MENFLTEPRSCLTSLQFVGGCYLCTYLSVPSCTRGCVWHWCSDFDRCESQWGEKPSPVQQGTGCPGAWGKILYTVVLNKMALPGQKRGYRAFRKNTGKGGGRASAFRSGYICDNSTSEKRTRHSLSTNKTFWWLR